MTYVEWVHELLRAHRAAQGHGRRKSGCWACDVLPHVTETDRERCQKLSLGAPGAVVSGGLDGHHVIPKQLLKREFPRGAQVTWHELPDGSAIWEPVPRDGPDAAWLELAELLVDVRIGVPLRRWHHDQWENGRLHVARRYLPAGVEEFAATFGLGWWLDRTFGSIETGVTR